MAAKTNITTLEDFKAEVKRQFAEQWPELSETQVDEFMESSEIASKVERDFNNDYQRLQSGEITQNVFDVGCTSSVAYCLSLMY